MFSDFMGIGKENQHKLIELANIANQTSIPIQKASSIRLFSSDIPQKTSGNEGFSSEIDPFSREKCPMLDEINIMLDEINIILDEKPSMLDEKGSMLDEKPSFPDGKSCF